MAVTAQPRQPIPLRPDPTALARSERRSLYRALAGLALSKPSSSIGPEQWVSRAWPDDVQAARIAKAASSPASTTSAAALQLSAIGIFRSLAPQSAALRLFDSGMSVDLTGLASVRVPNISNALPAVPFVAEAGMIPATNLTFNSATVGPIKKLAIISGISEELEEASPQLASDVIGRVLSDSVAKGLDVAALGTQAADGITPAGLLHGVPPLAAAPAGASAMATDLGALAGAIAAANIDASDLIYIASARLATIVKVSASPKFDNLVLSSLAMPDKSICAFAPAAVISSFGSLPEVERTTNALINFENNPAAGAGALSPPAYSIFQQRLIGIRLRAEVAWTIVVGGVAVITATNW